MRPGSNQLDMDGNRDYKDQVKPSLLDFLFTLALTIGIAPELVDRNGLASYDWYLAVPEIEFIVNIGGFCTRNKHASVQLVWVQCFHQQ